MKLLNIKTLGRMLVKTTSTLADVLIDSLLAQVILMAVGGTLASIAGWAVASILYQGGLAEAVARLAVAAHLTTGSPFEIVLGGLATAIIVVATIVTMLIYGTLAETITPGSIEDVTEATAEHIQSLGAGATTTAQAVADSVDAELDDVYGALEILTDERIIERLPNPAPTGPRWLYRLYIPPESTPVPVNGRHSREKQPTL